MDQSVRRGIVSMKGYAFVGDKIVTEAELRLKWSKISNLNRL
jgi:hypothetical protein